MTDPDQGTVSKPPEELIAFRGVTKVYGRGDASMQALRGIDLDIDEGEFVAIMGPSGSGKSTCMNILGCLDTPTAGSYRFKGVEVGHLTRNQRALLRRHYLGFVFQGYNLLSRTSALENVEVPLIYRGAAAAERHARAREALETVGLTGWETHTPGELSGGQQQRVAIARAIVTQPVGPAGGRTDGKPRFGPKPRDHGTADRPEPRPGDHRSSWSPTSRTWPPMRRGSSGSWTAWSHPISQTEENRHDRQRRSSGPARNPAQRPALLSDHPGHRHRRGGRDHHGDHRRRRHPPGPATDRRHGQQPAHGQPGQENGAAGQASGASLFKEADAEAIAAEISDIAAVAPVSSRSLQAIYGNQNWSTSVIGTDNRYLRVTNRALQTGRTFHDGELRAGAAVCIMGETVRKKLFGAQNALGERIRLQNFSCEVIGLLEAKGQSSMGQDQDDIVVIPLRTIQRRIAGNQDVIIHPGLGPGRRLHRQGQKGHRRL